ncbi:MAG: outer membrane protein assembly factor BamE [Holosporales bacterium]|jgi:outer membrane protein assembly factor BamE (lipoprotein component of BamABCDE complex)|nr:outer membrane protein assembly factor BamE [Holosporales bacterium]
MNRGYVGEFGDFNKVAVGKDTSQDVFERMGSPTASSSISSDGSYRWFYIAKKTEKTGPMDSKTIGQSVVVVTFSSSGVVKSVSKATGERDVKIVSDSAASGGKTAGVMGEVFGGLGKYRKQFEDAGK